MFKKSVRSIITLVLIIALLIPFLPTQVSAAYENTYKNTGNMRNDIIGVALTQVGYKEGANNYTKYGVWYGLSNSPWCGMFVSWCAKEAGIPTSVLKRTGIANPSNFGLSYKDGKNYTPQKGDLFFKKNFSHVGLVYYTEGAYFYTIEGNTSTTSYEGNSVMIRKRKISDFYFGTPNYKGSSSTSNSCDHNYKTKVESDHPHKEYKICSRCDKKTYTGNKKSSETCKTCIQNACKHTYGEWKNVGDGKHNRICNKCDYKQTKSHNWENGKIITEATCIAEGKQQLICSDCGAEKTKVIEKSDKHSYTDFSYLNESKHQKVCGVCQHQATSKHTVSKDWKYDSIYHWTSCSDCGGQIRHGEHSFPDGCLKPCEDCGYTLESGHKLTDELYSNDESHWQVCSRCDRKVNVTEHSYSSDCDEICNDCGFKRVTSVDHDDAYLADATGHWLKCSSCTRETDCISHSPNEDAEDWEDQVCIECNYILRSSSNHEHAFHNVECDATMHWGTCNCGKVLEAEVHSWDIQTGTCSICNAVNQTEPETEHSNFLVIFWNRIWKK